MLLNHALLYCYIDINADTEPPAVTVPNIVPSINVDPGMPDAAVTWSPLPSATDVVEGVIPDANILCQDTAGNVVMSGGRYSVGTTTVTCTASDSVPNTASDQFTITVIGRYCIFHGLKVSSLHSFVFVMFKLF